MTTAETMTRMLQLDQIDGALPEGEYRARKDELRELAGDADWRLTVSRDPFEVAFDEPLVQSVARIAGETDPVGVSFWADSGLIASAGIPTVLYGPIGEGAHAEVEWVDLDSVEYVRDVVLETAVEWCK